jgi:hypothetical protein
VIGSKRSGAHASRERREIQPAHIGTDLITDGDVLYLVSANPGCVETGVGPPAATSHVECNPRNARPLAFRRALFDTRPASRTFRITLRISNMR